eukprot:Tamp_13175.p1 GENE.Tamp_13175~~Tamp_13175.p1  ORF type:complete len:403 (+),score=45.10 Tamp_13175:48-1256(+)
MVKVDPDPVERVRWTSTRRANRDDNDDLDADSIMRGGVPLQSAEEDAPIALEDPWWVKLFGYKSPRKAVMFACFIIGVGLYLILAGTVQERLTRAIRLCEQLDQVDTSRNSISNWQEFLKVTHFHRPRAHGIQHVDRKMALKCAMSGWSHACTEKVFAAKARRHNGKSHNGAGLGPQVSETVTYEPGRRGRGMERGGLYSDELRLPVGVALGYHERLSVAEAKECAAGDIFHYICYTTSRRHKRKFESLKRSLQRTIKHISLKRDFEPLTSKRVLLLRTLLTEAEKAGVTTEISRPDLQEDSAEVLKRVLDKLKQHQHDHALYADIMLYPGSMDLLYRGQFLGLKFEGPGSLYHRDGKFIAYSGDWKDGRMNGYGTLYDSVGALVWEGYFEGGRPTRPFWVL